MSRHVSYHSTVKKNNPTLQYLLLLEPKKAKFIATEIEKTKTCLYVEAPTTVQIYGGGHDNTGNGLL